MFWSIYWYQRNWCSVILLLPANFVPWETVRRGMLIFIQYKCGHACWTLINGRQRSHQGSIYRVSDHNKLVNTSNESWSKYFLTFIENRLYIWEQMALYNIQTTENTYSSLYTYGVCTFSLFSPITYYITNTITLLLHYILTSLSLFNTISTQVSYMCYRCQVCISTSGGSNEVGHITDACP